MNARRTVTTIGWIWFGLGLLAFVAGLGGLLVSTVTGLPASAPPVRSVLMDFLWQHYQEGAAIQSVVALFIVFSAYMFLRRRSWTRLVIQIFSAVLLMWTVYFGIFWLRGVASMKSDSSLDHVYGAIRIVMLVGGTVVLGIFALSFGLCIWNLSRAAVKQEFRNAKQMG